VVKDNFNSSNLNTLYKMSGWAHWQQLCILKEVRHNNTNHNKNPKKNNKSNNYVHYILFLLLILIMINSKVKENKQAWKNVPQRFWHRNLKKKYKVQTRSKIKLGISMKIHVVISFSHWCIVCDTRLKGKSKYW